MCQITPQDIAPFLAPVATLVVGLSVAIIALLQFRVANNKLRLDLFDRRHNVYKATRRLMASIVSEAALEDAELYKFDFETSSAEFLFGPKVRDYLAEMRNRASDLRTHRKTYEPLDIGDERSRLVELEAAELKWFNKQHSVVKKVFLPYLDFSHVK